MAQKELRRMNRVELIEIIYALEQNEEELKQENQELRKKLEERKVVVEKAGFIAEAVAGDVYKRQVIGCVFGNV